MFAKSQPEHCRFCSASLEPEEVYRIEVPFFERTYPVCKPCRDSYAAGSRELGTFEPPFAADRTLRWCGPSVEDARVLLEKVVAELGAPTGDRARALESALSGDGRAALAWGRKAIEGKPDELDLALGMTGAIALGDELAPLDQLSRLVDRHAKTDATPLLLGVYAHALSGVALSGTSNDAGRASRDPLAFAKPANASQVAHLEAARGAYLLHLGFALKDELDGRVAALHVLATLALGDVDAAEAKLRGYRRSADAKPAARDPRLALAQALLQIRSGNLQGADDAIKTGLDWIRESREPARWADVEAALQFDAYVRAVEGGRWEPAREALKRYVKLRPQDRRAYFDLAHAYVKTELDPVAREVLASLHARDPRDAVAVLLYATCLHRLGDARAAWTLLRDDLEHEGEEERLGAERRHLAGVCAWNVGDSDRALELLAQARALSDQDAIREDLVFVLQAQVRERLDELTPESFPELVELLVQHGDALKKDFGEPGLLMIQSFVAREIRDGFVAAPSFGPDLFDKVRFSDADLTTLQAYSLLAQRRLGEAVRKDREAQAKGASPIPVDLLLRFLQLVKGWPDDARRGLLPDASA